MRENGRHVTFAKSRRLNGSEMSTEILVCVLCRWNDAPRDAPRAGRALFEAVQTASLGSEHEFPVRAVECMSGCKRACAIAIQAPDKFTYFFGDVMPDERSAQQAIECAMLHQRSADGFVSRDVRPERFREGILARIPPPQNSRRSESA